MATYMELTNQPRLEAGERSVSRAPARRAVRPWQLIVAAGLVAAGVFLVMHAVNELSGDGALLALDSENGVAAWFSATQFYAAGVVAAIVAFLDRRATLPWLVVGGLFLAFSLDDIVQVHEASERAADSRYSLLGLQPLVTVVLTGALLATSRRVDGPARNLLRAAAVALVIALSASVANGMIDGLPQPILLTLFGIEETAEMLMATFAIAAGVDRASRLVRVVRTV